MPLGVIDGVVGTFGILPKGDRNLVTRLEKALAPKGGRVALASPGQEQNKYNDQFSEIYCRNLDGDFAAALSKTNPRSAAEAFRQLSAEKAKQFYANLKELPQFKSANPEEQKRLLEKLSGIVATAVTKRMETHRAARLGKEIPAADMKQADQEKALKAMFDVLEAPKVIVGNPAAAAVTSAAAQPAPAAKVELSPEQKMLIGKAKEALKKLGITDEKVLNDIAGALVDKEKGPLGEKNFAMRGDPAALKAAISRTIRTGLKANNVNAFDIDLDQLSVVRDEIAASVEGTIVAGIKVDHTIAENIKTICQDLQFEATQLKPEELLPVATRTYEAMLKNLDGQKPPLTPEQQKAFKDAVIAQLKGLPELKGIDIDKLGKSIVIIDLVQAGGANAVAEKLHGADKATISQANEIGKILKEKGAAGVAEFCLAYGASNEAASQEQVEKLQKFIVENIFGKFQGDRQKPGPMTADTYSKLSDAEKQRLNGAVTIMKAPSDKVEIKQFGEYIKSLHTLLERRSALLKEQGMPDAQIGAVSSVEDLLKGFGIAG